MQRSIGIIANPASGKDIRRLVSYATVIDNNEKVNIVKRIVLAAQAVGINKIYIMPDTFLISQNITHSLKGEGVLTADVETLDIYMDATADDSTRAAEEMEKLGVGCIVVLGGDGTSRAVAKGVTHTPIMPISTGTNNVYPQMLEGTVAGMAAASVSLMPDGKTCCIRDKRIEIFVNGKLVDIALVDAVLTTDLYPGAKAVWDFTSLRFMVVSRCHPATIGFSAVAGCIRPIADTDDIGMIVFFGSGGKVVKAPIAAGMLEDIEIEKDHTIPLNEMVEFKISKAGMLALDGEREVKVREGDTLGLCITRNGPWRVLPLVAVEQAMDNFFWR